MRYRPSTIMLHPTFFIRSSSFMALSGQYAGKYFVTGKLFQAPFSFLSHILFSFLSHFVKK